MPVSSAYAQFEVPGPTPADSPCDPKYYDSLKARAWMEAQREITSNQTLIFKPDSVLEYTCFDQFMYEMNRDAPKMFSGHTRWGTILPPNSMLTTLESVIGGAYDAYLESNFNHNLLGGRSETEAYTRDPRGNPTSFGNYDCDIMGNIWQEAKCRDFIASEHDGFFTFDEYADTDNPDRRTLPNACGKIDRRWRDNIGWALVDSAAEDDPPETTFTPWVEDFIITFMAMLDPIQCNGPVTTEIFAVIPIPTGITVIRSAGTPATYPEKACVAPGCHYDPELDQCIKP